MYIEAFKEAHVMEAVRGLRNVLVSKGAKLVPLKEMVEAITVNTKAKRAIGDSGSLQCVLFTQDQEISLADSSYKSISE